MALTPATLQELQAALLSVIDRASKDRPTTGQLFQFMYNTGLRVREVLEVDRWHESTPGQLTVQLEKREGTRSIDLEQIPEELRTRYIQHLPFELETYSAVNNTFKYHGPGILFGTDTRRTTCHSFRYQFMKQLSEDGLTVAQVGEVMGHVNPANTARYIMDEIRLGS